MNSPYDLREWLVEMEQHGQLLAIDEEVDIDEEMGAITYLVARTPGRESILFKKPSGDETGFEVSLLWNLIGPSLKRCALTFGLPGDTTVLELTRHLAERFGTALPTIEVPAKTAPLFEHSLYGDDIDLTKWPIPKHWARDGGRYGGTGDIVITSDPDTGVENVGTYRMMLQGPRHVGLHMSPGKGAGAHLAAAWKAGKPLPVAAAWGVHPLFMIIGSQNVRPDVSEYEYLGGLLGKSVTTTLGPETALPLPAEAEMVIEGEIAPDSMRDEGPFGEFTGHYGSPMHPSPLMEVKAVHFRSRPVLTNALMGEWPSNEHEVFLAVMRAARIWSELNRLGITGIRGVYSHPASASGFGMTVVSLEQRHVGHAKQVLNLAAHVPAGSYFTKWVIVVDHDIDPTNIDEVLWAMSTRCSPAQRISIHTGTWNTQLDPSIFPVSERTTGSRCLIDATMDFRHLDEVSPRTLLKESTYEQVRARWSQLGSKYPFPEVTSFE